MSDVPSIVVLVGTILGSFVGIAALIRTFAGSTGTIADGAAQVVKSLERRLDRTEQRLEALETYADHFDDWADQALELLRRLILQLPETLREEAEAEERSIRAARPRRRKVDR